MLEMTSTNDENRQLLEYFESIASYLSGLEFSREYVRGALLTREWLDLKQRHDITQGVFDEFIQRIEDWDAPGSGYGMLWCRVKEWGYSLGLLVPETHPWNVDRREVVCLDSTAFESQLSVGKKYRLLTSDDERMLVRVVNDAGRHRWYPYKHFQFSVRPERKLIRKSNGAEEID